MELPVPTMDMVATAVPALLDIRKQTARVILMNVYRTLVKMEAPVPYVIQQMYNVNVCFFNINFYHHFQGSCQCIPM